MQKQIIIIIIINNNNPKIKFVRKDSIEINNQIKDIAGRELK